MRTPRSGVAEGITGRVWASFASAAILFLLLATGMARAEDGGSVEVTLRLPPGAPTGVHVFLMEISS